MTPPLNKDPNAHFKQIHNEGHINEEDPRITGSKG